MKNIDALTSTGHTDAEDTENAEDIEEETEANEKDLKAKNLRQPKARNN
jgi:hypothetical protein